MMIADQQEGGLAFRRFGSTEVAGSDDAHKGISSTPYVGSRSRRATFSLSIPLLIIHFAIDVS